MVFGVVFAFCATTTSDGFVVSSCGYTLLGWSDKTLSSSSLSTIGIFFGIGVLYDFRLSFFRNMYQMHAPRVKSTTMTKTNKATMRPHGLLGSSNLQLLASVANKMH
jgi:hypothetical protein